MLDDSIMTIYLIISIRMTVQALSVKRKAAILIAWLKEIIYQMDCLYAVTVMLLDSLSNFIHKQKPCSSQFRVGKSFQ